MKKVMFVCLGNICRSPSAEAIFNHLVKEQGLENQMESASSGTSGYHQGEPADARMQQHGRKRGYKFDTLSQQFMPEDFDRYDHIFVMDGRNYHDIKAQDYRSEYDHKIHNIVDFCVKKKYAEVPDPYSGGPEGFERVLDMLEDACETIVSKLKSGEL